MKSFIKESANIDTVRIFEQKIIKYIFLSKNVKLYNTSLYPDLIFGIYKDTILFEIDNEHKSITSLASSNIYNIDILNFLKDYKSLQNYNHFEMKREIIPDKHLIWTQINTILKEKEDYYDKKKLSQKVNPQPLLSFKAISYPSLPPR